MSSAHETHREYLLRRIDPMVFVEEFEVASWMQHLRQHERFTNADRELESKIRQWQVADVPVRVTHSHVTAEL